MNTNRGIWGDEEAFLELFKGVTKEGGTSSGNFSLDSFRSVIKKMALAFARKARMFKLACQKDAHKAVSKRQFQCPVLSRR